MKRLLMLSSAVAVLMTILGAAAVLESTSIEAQLPPQLQTATLPVSGMTCAGCETAVEAAVRSLPGVVSVKASYKLGNAVVQYDPSRVTPEAMIRAITDATYYRVGKPIIGAAAAPSAADERPRANSSAVIRVEGMTDDRAASQVLAAMARPEAIADASVNLAAGTVTVKYDGTKVSAETLVGAIDQGTPFRASLVQKQESEHGGSQGGASYLLWWSAGAAGLIALIAVVVWGRQRWLQVGHG